MSNENSVEWIIKQLIFKTEFENLPNHYVLMSDKDIDSIIEQAKAMHKQEIIDSFGVGCQVESTRLIGYHGMAEKYYNETFGGNK